MATSGYPDLWSPPTDLRGADLSGFDLSTGSDMGSSFTCRGTDAPGALLKQATNTITLPASTGSHTYTLDIDGDGKPENQLKTIVAALSVSGLDLQSQINTSVAAGEMVYLVDLATLKLDSSTCTGVTLYLAQPPGTGSPPPKYDGTDVFVRDPSTKAELSATIASGVLTSTAPKSLTKSTESRIDLTLDLNGTPLVLPVRGVHIQGTLAVSGTQLFIQNGQLNGVVSKTDIDGRVLPTIATAITQMIHADPTGSTSMTLIALFENTANPISKTKCMVAADCCHTSPSTCKILPEEISASPIGGVLAPDVQAFNDSDEWAPIPGGSNKNGMSLGIGFSSVPAKF